jgi:outer membrane protein assembly factor BamA
MYKTLLALSLLIPFRAPAQTRTEELTRQREELAQKLTPEKSTRVEEFLRHLKDDKVLQRTNYGYKGIGLAMGGLVTGSGFAIGPSFFRDDLYKGNLAVQAAAQISFKNYSKASARLSLPKLLNSKLFTDIAVTHRNYPGIAYYGPGPDSQKMRTNYRLEDTSADATAGISPFRFFRAGGGLGFLAVNIGAGRDSRFASTDQTFTPAQVPGIDNQTNFLRYGTFAQFDYRDNPLGPRNGGNYVLQYTRYEDRDLRLHDFNLLDIDLQQYVGFFNRSRVIALRAHTRLTDTRDGQTVPFYLQPVIGGSDDLRGFRQFRFSGQNSLALGAEYRWAIFSGCDGALFVDGGKVFARRGQLNFKDLEGSAGFGLRFNARNRTFMRLDVGFSHEGFQVWFKFNDVFQQRPLGTADSQPIL